MKKIFLILALACTTVLANAQKTAQDFQKDVAAKKAACEDAKKGVKTATWIAYAKSLVKAYDAPKGDAILGTLKANFPILMGGPAKSISSEMVGNEQYEVHTYPSCKYYFGPNGQLVMMVATKVYVENALEDAVQAYAQAAKLDPKGSKTKEIAEGISGIAAKFQEEAGRAYQFGDMAASSVLFEKAADAASTEPNAVVDTLSYFNAGITAVLSGDNARAKDLFSTCITLGYKAKGDVYFRLAECYKNLGDNAKCKEILEHGFELYPDNQGIIVSLINLYIDSKDDPSKLFVLLDKAKANDPKNASLYYVEGNIHKQLGEIAAAEASYDKCADVNPEYEFGYIGKALMYCEEADKIRELADKEYDDKKYMALVEKFEGFCEMAIGPFEKAFELSKDNQTKLSLAEYLKNLYYRFRDKDDQHKAAYEKYSNIVKNGLQ